MNLGLRYDYYQQGYPDIHLPATRYVPRSSATFRRPRWWGGTMCRLASASPTICSATDAPRVKASINRYNVQGLFLNDQNPARANVTMQRTWTDPNGDFIIQGDPFNPGCNGELGPSQNRNFGREIIPYNFDPGLTPSARGCVPTTGRRRSSAQPRAHARRLAERRRITAASTATSR